MIITVNSRSRGCLHFRMGAAILDSWCQREGDGAEGGNRQKQNYSDIIDIVECAVGITDQNYTKNFHDSCQKCSKTV